MTIHFSNTPTDGVEYSRKDGAWVPATGGSGGESNRATSPGAGEPITMPLDGVNLPFKSLIAGANIGFTVGVDTITIEATTVVTAHDGLTGLDQDDHPQYQTQARGDARYYLQAQVDSLLAPKIEANSYAGETTGGTLKVRHDPATHTLYMTNDGSNP